MKQCQQCGRPAVVRISDNEGELYLCLDCNLKFEHAETLEFQRTAQQFNLAAAAFETVSGLPGMLPRMPVPPVRTLPVSNTMNIHNINVQDSVVGVINTGSIEAVDNAITVLKQSGADAMAVAIAKLTESVINSAEAESELKNELVEILSVLGEEATKPQPQRRIAVVRALFGELSTGFSGLASLTQLWQQYGPVIQAFFS
jgi:hypothetical protein